MTLFHLNIGSNIGNRHAFIGRAVADVILLKGVRDVRITRPIESEPWGFDSSRPFVNIGLTGLTSMTAEDLFGRLAEIQNRISMMPHRRPDDSYCDRELDIDLICFGTLVINTPVLTLPHPRMHLRRFVLEPMAEQMPRWVHPLLQLTPKQLLASLTSSHNS